MEHLLKNVFWLKGKNEFGNEKFFPITFSKDLDKIYLVYNDNCYLFLYACSKEEIRQKLEDCISCGYTDFISPYGLTFYPNTKLYHAPKLFETAIKNYTFKNLPIETSNFIYFEEGAFYPDYFENFCATRPISSKRICSFSRAFKKASIILENEAKVKNLNKFTYTETMTDDETSSQKTK